MMLTNGFKNISKLHHRPVSKIKRGCRLVMPAFVALVLLMSLINFQPSFSEAQDTTANIIQVSAGDAHSLALDDRGNVFAWGSNKAGQLGTGKIEGFEKIPVQVCGPEGKDYLAGIVAISAGGSHSLALKSDGTVWAWGSNKAGQLGNGGTKEAEPYPVQVRYSHGGGYLAGIVAISAGGNHSLALGKRGEENGMVWGTIWSWGSNTSGQLGVKDADQVQPLPVDVKFLYEETDSDDVMAFSAGGHHTLALKIEGGDNAAWAWGHNKSGQVGDTTSENRSVPVRVYYEDQEERDLFENVSSVSAGSYHSAAVDLSNQIWAWGNNEQGQLGIGYISSGKDLALKVIGGAAAVSAGGKHTLAILFEGGNSVWAWGDDDKGQLGRRSGGGQYPTPHPVLGPGSTGTFDRATQVSAGGEHSLLLRDDNTVWAWGDNSTGQVGVKGAGTIQDHPAKVFFPLTSVSLVAEPGSPQPLGTEITFTAHAVGGSKPVYRFDIKGPGVDWFTVKPLSEENFLVYTLPEEGLWQVRVSAQCGLEGTQVQRIIEYYISPAAVIAVSAGGIHSMALISDGTVWSWGSNQYGQVGDGTGGDIDDIRKLPVQVVSSGGGSYLENIVAISAGYAHSLALRNDGTVWSWGDNRWGQLGDGTGGGGILSSDIRLQPVQVKGPGGEGFLTGIIAISAGVRHSMALKSDGTVWTWGEGLYGQLGDLSDTTRLTPVNVGERFLSFGPGGTYQGYAGLGELADIVAINAGSRHSLALKSTTVPYAWGCYFEGQLGTGSSGEIGDNHRTAIRVKAHHDGVPPQMIDVAAVSAGYDYSLAIKEDSTVWAWGWNDCGQLGIDSTESQPHPVQVKDYTGQNVLDNIVAISAGGAHSLALRSDGDALAWGGNDRGQLGDGTGGDSGIYDKRLIPVYVRGIGGASRLNNIVAISAGSVHSLALRSDGTVWAWGDNRYGQIGNGYGGGYFHHYTTPEPVRFTSYTITAKANPTVGGTIYWWGGDGVYGEGQEVRLSAIANPGYEFLYWTEGVEVVWYSEFFVFEAYSERQLVANFEPVHSTLSWTRLAPENAVALAYESGTLAVAFKEIGVWEYDGSGWIRLAPENAVALAYDHTGKLAVAFKEIGVWEYDGSGWSRLAPENAVALAYDHTGKLAVAFKEIGVWEYDGSGWVLLAPENAVVVAYDNAGTLAVAFKEIGVWEYDGSGWVLLAPENAVALAYDDTGKLAVAFADIGVWEYDGSGWVLLAPENAVALAYVEGGNLAVAFKELGLWQYQGTWSRLAPENVVALAYDAGSLAVAFEDIGVWLYD